MLPKKKIKSLISELRNVKSEDLLSQVYKDVGSGYHLKHYPERQAFWDVCVQTKALDPFVNTLFDKYLDLVVGLKGREKYASLQVQWMELLRSPPLFFLCALARVYKLLLVPSPHPAFCHLLSALSWVGPRYNTHISTCLCTHPSRRTLTLRCVSDVPTVTLCSWATPAVSLPCSDSCLHNQNRGDETH